MSKEDSKFNGSALGLFGRSLLVFFLSTITLGFMIPWSVCYIQRWYCKNTIIDGKRLVFDGLARQLIGKYILWTFLTLITAGIYGIWESINIHRWYVKHTHIEGVTNKISKFNGSVISFLGVNLLVGFVSIISLGFMIPWAMCYRQRYLAKHTTYDEKKLIFEGRARKLFFKFILWIFLSIISVSILLWKTIVRIEKWKIADTHFV